MSDYKEKTIYVACVLMFLTGSMQVTGGILYVLDFTAMNISASTFDISDVYGLAANWIYFFNEWIEKLALLSLEILFFKTFWETMKKHKTFKGVEEEARLTYAWNIVIIFGIVTILLSNVMEVIGQQDASQALNLYQFDANVATFVNLRFRSTALKIMDNMNHNNIDTKDIAGKSNIVSSSAYKTSDVEFSLHSNK
ncbi:hypothetical protein HDV06_006260 [Boothiomyces sp. JEL0866]|nr:hypothetical protein HDV06_006260 [Boothiomyces sp. JEL0866]